MPGVNDVPPQARGTVSWGGRPHHYRRSVLNGQLYPHPGPDTRDWAAIDAGAIDYADIAAMEHQQDGFTDHDGPRIKAACPVCSGAESAVPTGRDMNTQAAKDAALVALARQGNVSAMTRAIEKGLIGPEQRQTYDTLVMPADIPPERQAILDREAEARSRQAEAEANQALIDQTQKAQIKAQMQAERSQGVTGAADPKDNAGIPPTDPDVVAGAAPEMQEQAMAAKLESLADTALSTGIFPPTTVGNESATSLAPGMGRDPFTGDAVKITRNPGADADAPYGRKKDGTPRRPGGKAR